MGHRRSQQGCRTAGGAGAPPGLEYPAILLSLWAQGSAITGIMHHKNAALEYMPFSDEKLGNFWGRGYKPSYQAPPSLVSQPENETTPMSPSRQQTILATATPRAQQLGTSPVYMSLSACGCMLYISSRLINIICSTTSRCRAIAHTLLNCGGRMDELVDV